MTGLDEKTLRQALQRIHHVAIGESKEPYMSIPADPKRDADLQIAGAIDELVALRDRVKIIAADILDVLRHDEDRPTEGLSEKSRERFIEDLAKLRDLKATNITVVTRKHDPVGAMTSRDVTNAWETVRSEVVEREHGPEEVESLRDDHLLLRETDRALRELLFVSHGCTGPALYGDDGELQDKVCGIDFRRDSVEMISAKLAQRGIDMLALHTDRHDSEARNALGEVWRHRLGPDGSYPETGVVEAAGAIRALGSAYAEIEMLKGKRRASPCGVCGGTGTV